MKKLLALIGLAALVALPILAGDATYVITTVGVSTAAASTATNVAAVIYVGHQDKVCVQLESTNSVDKAGTAATRNFYFQRSVDNVTYDPTLIPVGLTENGKNVVCVSTQLSSYGAGYIRLSYWTNSNDTGTNGGVVLRYGIKTQAP